MKASWKSLSIVLIVLSVLLAACGGDDKSPEEARADLCTDLDGLEAAVTSLQGLGADASIDDLESERDAINDALDDVRSSADDVEDVEVDALNDAYESLDNAVDDISDDMSIDDAIASVQDELTAVQTAWQDLLTLAECP